MALSHIVIFGVLFVIATGNGFPQHQEFRAKAIPFGSHVEQRQPLVQRTFFQPEVLSQPRSVVIIRESPQKSVFHIKDPQVDRTERVIPKAPTLVEEEKIKESLTLPIRSQTVPINQVVRTKADEDALFKKQAESAKYEFETFVDDGINGHSHLRTEKRNGLAVEGMYSYSDGFYRRTIFYAADDKGYRVTKEEVEPIGDGPLINPDGEAVVRSSLGSQYTITKADLQQVNEKN